MSSSQPNASGCKSFSATRKAVSRHYNLLHEIGGGEISRVFFAVERITDKTSVVIIYKSTEVTTILLSETVHNNVLILKRLQHPNIPGIPNAHEIAVEFLSEPCFAQGILWTIDSST